MSAGPAAGWYDDSQDPDLLRYWDGTAWTAHTQPRLDDTVENWFPASQPLATGGSSRALPADDLSVAATRRGGAHRASGGFWFARKRVMAPIMLVGLVGVGGVVVAWVNDSGPQRGEALLARESSTADPTPTADLASPTETPSTSDTTTSEAPSATPRPVPQAARAPRPTAKVTTRPPRTTTSATTPRATTPPPRTQTPTAPPRRPSPTRTQRPSPTSTPSPTWDWNWDDWNWGGGGRVFYRNCDEVRAAGKAPLLRGQPGYRRKLDPDRDGVACA